jgi:hypothetical protein
VAFRLSLWFGGEQLCTRDDDTDDPVVAIYNCRQFEAEVVPVLRQAAREVPTFKKFKRLSVGELEKHTDRIVIQFDLSLNGNGNHP